MSGALDIPMPGPTERLGRIRELLKRARIAEQMMKHGRTGQDRDHGTVAYVGAVDAVLVELSALDDIGALDELTRFASVTWGRA